MVGNQPKITLITNADFPYGKSGENFTRNIALGLAANDAIVNVIRYRGRMFTHKNDVNIQCQDYLFKRHPKNGALKALQILLNSLFTPFFVLYRKFFKKDEVFVIFALKYSYELFPFLFWCKILNISIYQVIADHYTSINIVPVWWKKPKYYAYLFQRKYLDRYFDGLIVLSKFLKTQALKNHVAEKKLLLLPHFIVFSNEDKVKKYPIEKQIICYCGTLSIANGITDLIDAFQILKRTEKNIELRLVGGKSEEVGEYLRNSNIDTSNIVFTGFVEKQEVENEMQQSTVLVNPRKESDWAEAGFPTKIGEYFATQTPVVTTRVGDLNHYFNDKQEVVFATPNDSESLSKAISYILNNKDKAIAIGEHGYNWAKENLDFVRNSKRMIDFIESEKV